MNFEVPFYILLTVVQFYVAFKFGMVVAEVRERNRREDRIKALGELIKEMNEEAEEEKEEKDVDKA